MNKFGGQAADTGRVREVTSTDQLGAKSAAGTARRAKLPPGAPRLRRLAAPLEFFYEEDAGDFCQVFQELYVAGAALGPEGGEVRPYPLLPGGIVLPLEFVKLQIPGPQLPQEIPHGEILGHLHINLNGPGVALELDRKSVV